MRNIFKTSLAAIFVMATCMLAFTSCSDDDDDNGGAPSGNGSAMVTEAKVLLEGVTKDGWGDWSYKFYYDDQLRPYYSNEADGYDELFRIDYNAGKIDLWGEIEGLSVSFNSKGYITKISGSWNLKENEYGYETSYSGSLTYVYSYDADGQLVAVDMSDNETSVDKWGVNSDKWVCKNVLTWKDGNLIKSEVNSTSEENDGDNVVVSVGKGITNITYGNQPNKYRLYPRIFCDDDFSYMAVGLLGVGPKMLPRTFTESEEETEDGRILYKYEDDKTGSFTLNDNGTINTETWSDSETGGIDYQYAFHYIPVSAASSAKANVAPAPLTRSSARSKIERIRKALGVGLFMPHRKSNR